MSSMEISNFKMAVTPEQSRIVQEFLFKNGCRWADGSNKIACTKAPYLKLDSTSALGLYYCILEEDFRNFQMQELTFEEFKQKYMKETLTTQVGGSHYQNYAIQPIEFIVKNNIPFLEANVIKYVVRYKDKNGLEDLKKAKHYLEMLIENYDTKE